MGTYTEIGDTIKGDRIIAEARKISDVRLISKSGRHKAQRVILKENALCVADKKIRFIK